MNKHPFNDKQLYYLNQMGITPWVKRQGSINDDQQQAMKLIIFIAEEREVQCQTLFNNIMHYLNVSIPEIKTIPSSKQNKIIANLASAQAENTPLVILAFGNNWPQLKEQPYFFHVPSLKAILINPALKKKAYLTLFKIRSIFSKKQQSKVIAIQSCK